MSEWPVLKALPSYGRGRDAAGGRFASLIFGTNLTDVVVTGRFMNAVNISTFIFKTIMSLFMC